MKTVGALFVVLLATTAVADIDVKCECTLYPSTDGMNPNGQVLLEEKSGWLGVALLVKISGFGAGKVQHGFHVHEHGNVSGKCKAAGGHFNPFNKVHGGPTASERHAGDLGNIHVGEDKTVNTRLFSEIVSLHDGPNDIRGKSLVLHAGPDDLGLGNVTGSNTTGNAGGRLNCCIIEKCKEVAIAGTSRDSPLHWLAVLAVLAAIAASGSSGLSR